MAEKDTPNHEPLIATPASTWGIAFLAAVVTVLWKTGTFSLWHSIIGITLLLMVSASAAKYEFTISSFLAYCALKALCCLLTFGVLINLLLEALPSRAWHITVHRFSHSFGAFVYFVIWIIFGIAFYFGSSGRRRR